jgi:hypothetical protein
MREPVAGPICNRDLDSIPAELETRQEPGYAENPPELPDQHGTGIGCSLLLHETFTAGTVSSRWTRFRNGPASCCPSVRISVRKVLI